jgi:predicted DNA-binding ribbon-helix-helix protein
MSKVPPKKSTRTTVTLPTQDYRELERIALRQRVSVAWLIRAAVDRYLTDQSPLFRRNA